MSTAAAALAALQITGQLAYAETVGPVTDDLGVVRVNKDKPIVIGGLLAMSGPDSSLGIDEFRGAELGFADAENMIAGHPIRFTVEDGQCNAEGGQTAATKLASDRSIVVVVGSSCSSEARAGAPILWSAGLTAVSPGASAPSLTFPDRPEGLKGFLRTMYNDTFASKVAARYAFNGMKAKTAATVHDGSPVAEQVVKAFTEDFTALGGSVTTAEAVGPNDTDFRPMLAGMARKKPDIIFMPLFGSAAAYVVRQAAEVPELKGVPKLGTDGLFNPAFLEASGDASVGFRIIGVDSSPNILGEKYKVFLDKYQAKYGEGPLTGFHTYGYDAAGIVKASIEKVAVTDAEGNTYIGKKALHDALMATKDFDGLSGKITCSENGDCGTAAFAIFEYTSSDPASFKPGTNPIKIYQEPAK
ncbi:branched-chain amino acid ABC transporter substrate-binding protein [Mesorhizobium sp. M7D.F.Ca.US.004.03.1.1]|nr:branched-chain amino acid ABC transporter substrate-binding protein [Mesorhizobium sp. M7D.F.Ca.US.004.03.1.1]